MARRRAVVTGGSSGIGKAIAIALAQNGYEVFATGRKGERLLELQSYSENVITLQQDLLEPCSAEKIASGAVESMGGVDLLINCAADHSPEDFFSLDIEAFVDCFRVKAISTLALCKLFWPFLKVSGEGHIINIIGSAAKRPRTDNIQAGLINACVANLTKALNEYGVRDRIRVNAVSPALILTDRLEQKITRLSEKLETTFDEAERFLVEEAKSISIGRVDHVVSTVFYLEKTKFVHSAILNVDGGTIKEC